ncbi:MAG TPA: hypothetical protein VGM96_10940 [Reyranella sp.]|jgi:hypothetical protein
MHRTTLFLAAIVAPVAASAADEVFQFQLAPDPANMAGCIALAPQLERGQTVVRSGDRVEITAAGGIKTRMDPVQPGFYRTVVELAGERLEYTLDLGAARTLSVRGNNLGCKWSGKSR